MNTEVRYLPYSGRRYAVSKCGSVVDNEENVLNPFLHDNVWKVRIGWLFGECDYEVGLLVLVTFSMTDLDEHLLPNLRTLYKDGNQDNLNASNLSYRFENGPLEDENHPGYFIVPFFERYAISKEGHFLNRKTGSLLHWNITAPDPVKNSKGGYRYLRAVAPSGNSLVVFRHRAIGYTFLNYPGNVHELVVNHIDGIPGNDGCENLEWATYAENNLHAARTGLRTVGYRKLLCKNYATGEIERFPNLTLATVKYPHLTRFHIVYRLDEGCMRLFPDHLLFRDDAEDVTWPDRSELLAVKEMAKVQYLIKDVVKNTVEVVGGLNACSQKTGVAVSQLSTHITNQHEIPVHGFLVRRLEDSPTWPEYTDKHLKIFANHSRQPCNGVDVEDTETGETFFFCCREAAGKHFGISAAYVSDLCVKRYGRSGTPLYKKRYKFSNFLIRFKAPGPSLEQSRAEKPSN